MDAKIIGLLDVNISKKSSSRHWTSRKSCFVHGPCYAGHSSVETSTEKISPAALDARQQECTCFSGLVDDRCSFPWLRDKGSNLATSHFLARKNSRWRMANGTQTPALCWFQHQCHFFSTLWRADRADPVCKVSLEMQKWWDDLGWTQLADTRC
jgi:hypothetical protein